MRLNYLISGLLLVGLAGCAKSEVEPEKACGTLATVRLCMGLTAICPTEHTTLVLADGTLLRPSGPAWQAYQPHQVNGQLLRIGYTLAQPLPSGEVGNVRATLTCLELQGLRCGTPDPRGE